MVRISYTVYDKVPDMRSRSRSKNSQRSFLSLESRHITGQVSKSPKMSDRPQNSDVAENKENTFRR